MAAGMTRDLAICTAATKDRTQFQIQSTFNYSMCYSLPLSCTCVEIRELASLAAKKVVGLNRSWRH